jgi:hypothetical protein
MRPFVPTARTDPPTNVLEPVTMCFSSSVTMRINSGRPKRTKSFTCNFVTRVHRVSHNDSSSGIGTSIICAANRRVIIWCPMQMEIGGLRVAGCFCNKKQNQLLFFVLFCFGFFFELID